MFSQSGLQPSDGFLDVDLATGTGDLVYYHGLFLHRQCVIHLVITGKRAEGPPCLEGHPYVELSADPSYLLADTCNIMYGNGSSWCLFLLLSLLSWSCRRCCGAADKPSAWGIYLYSAPRVAVSSPCSSYCCPLLSPLPGHRGTSPVLA